MTNLTKIEQAVAPAFATAKERYALDLGRELGYAQMIATNNADLAGLINQAHPSVIDSIRMVASVGLTLNPALGLAYLIPRGGKACYSPSYQGLVRIAVEAGCARYIDVQVVRKGDNFKVTLGSNTSLIHEPSLEGGDIIGAYAIAHLPTGDTMIEILTARDIADAKRVGGKNTWAQWEGEMIKKFAVRRLFKRLPKADMRPDDEQRIAATIEADNGTTDQDPEQTGTPTLLPDETPAEKQRRITAECKAAATAEEFVGCFDELVELLGDPERIAKAAKHLAPSAAAVGLVWSGVAWIDAPGETITINADPV